MALDQMNFAPAWVKRQPEFLLLQASTLLAHGNTDEGGRILRELEKKQPRFIPLYQPLATRYLLEEWPAHTLQAIRKVINAPGFDAGARELSQALLDTATTTIESLA